MRIRPIVTDVNGSKIVFPPEITEKYAVEIVPEPDEDAQVISASLTTEKGKLDTYGKDEKDEVENER